LAVALVSELSLLITMTEEKEGPSKNELKKLAKKAEKAAMKQQQKDPTSAPAAAPAAAAATSQQQPKQNVATLQPKQNVATPALASPPCAPELLVVYPQPSPSLLKVVWAAEKFGVAIKASASPPKDVSHFFGSTKKTALVYGDAVVGGGGNAMAMAIAGMKTHEGTFLEQAQVDDWCEWERTVLRHDPKKALPELEAKLQGRLHLVGHGDTVADLCVLSTLDAATVTELPPDVAKYVQAHAAAREAAQAAMKELCQSKPAVVVDLSQNSLVKILHAVFVEAVCSMFPGVEMDLPVDIIRKCGNAKHGDYQCTAAMRAFGVLKKEGNLPPNVKSPAQLADALVDAIGTDNVVIQEVAVQEGAFVVFRIRSSFLEEKINAIVAAGKLPFPEVPKQTCVVDFSSPNIAKEMHVGHLRSSIIGESVCRILEAVGHDVHRVNHVGDWGTQFGTSFFA
jgi:hypothetical protein